MDSSVIDKAFQQQRLANRNRAAQAVGGLRKTHSINRTLFYNTLAVGRQKYNCHNVWDEPEFVADCERWHPEIKIGHESNMVALSGGGGGAKNRFGRVKERWVCRNGEMIRVL